jgi:hypothetical protein
MAYFNHAYQKCFIATKPTVAAAGILGEPAAQAGVTDGVLTSVGVHVSNIKSSSSAEGYQLGVGVVGLFSAKTHLSVTSAEIDDDCCPFYLAGASLKLNDKQGPFHGGYQESNKSKIINPKYVRKTWKAEANPAGAAHIQVGGTDDNVAGDATCEKEFLCGETYYLRIEVKGTSALRFANHNLYRTLDASGGCCADPSSPVAVTSDVIYKQYVEQIANDPYLKDFINPILVVDGDSFAYDEERAAVAGLAAGKIISAAPAAAVNSGMILMGAYVETEFGDCTFQCSDYYNVEPVQITASEVDLNGDPCTFAGMCIVESCPGVQSNGSGEQKVRALISSESYLQNFVSSDLRIREITQGNRAYEVLDRQSFYGAFYILHSVPRFNNPSGTFDNDQYLLEIIGNTGTLTYLEAEFDAIEAGGCITCGGTEDHTAVGCVIPALPTA